MKSLQIVKLVSLSVIHTKNKIVKLVVDGEYIVKVLLLSPFWYPQQLFYINNYYLTIIHFKIWKGGVVCLQQYVKLHFQALPFKVALLKTNIL